LQQPTVSVDDIVTIKSISPWLNSP